jgi:hypothetical protein
VAAGERVNWADGTPTARRRVADVLFDQRRLG